LRFNLRVTVLSLGEALPVGAGAGASGPVDVRSPHVSETIYFPGSTGARLAGVLDVPDGDVKGSILLAHCFTCSKDLHTMTRLARGFADGGYAVMRFDFTGLGDSDGDFTTSTLAHDVRDLAAAATELIGRGFGPCGLLGHSLGGAASLLAAERLKTVRSVVTIGAPASPDHVRHLFTDVADGHDGHWDDGETVELTIGGRTFAVARGFLADLAEHDQAGAIAGLGRPLLVLHAVEDEVVGVEEGERIFAAAAQPKGFQPLFDADHLLTDRRAAQRALQLALDWFDATL
jgi:alpha-beta hydrolase superfamily lysophospholipase